MYSHKYLMYLLVLGFASLSAQTNDADAPEYHQTILQKLTSAEFSGRGYTDSGMWKAADFIATEFEKIGLKKIGDSYFQQFSMPINIIENAELKINGKELKYGIDFLVKPNSKPQDFHKKELYIFNPEDYAKALESESKLKEFIVRDMQSQDEKHIVFPPHQFEADSLSRYYKNWPNFYRPDENRDRAIFFFTKDKLTASLSQVQDSISEFLVADKFYSKDLKLDNYSIKADFVKDFKARNVIGKIEGKNPDSLIVITAHYDHLGKVGSTIFPGASDNASGTAFLLELASYFSTHKPKYSLVFIAFAAEEAGLVGSLHFVENPLFDLNRIKFLLNFDIMGAGEEGIQIVNSSIFTKEYELLKQINSEKNLIHQIKRRGEACNSDHCPFYRLGVPSFFTYTLGGPGHYHDPLDTADTLNLDGFLNLKELFVAFIEGL
ncbi:MAG: M28 family peptidase [Weeksellaceae bacterium]|nr:M28 family peptidase [Weeksellaceae bacterium]